MYFVSESYFSLCCFDVCGSFYQAPSDPDTLANIITVSYHLQRPQDVINRYLKYVRFLVDLTSYFIFVLFIFSFDHYSYLCESLIGFWNCNVNTAS